MTKPSKIWTDGHDYWAYPTFKDDKTEYIRADLAHDPLGDARVKALVEALRGLVPILCEGVEDGCGKLSRHDCSACEGYAALAAFNKGGKDE